jgi:solute carrier family 25 carnitine/acylcarnitine transporter 20/29
LQTSSEYAGMVDCAMKTIAKDGPLGLYRGITAPLISITPIFATYFWGYDQGKNIARAVGNIPDDKPIGIGWTVFAGGFSAIPGTAVMVPGERVKVLMQIQGQGSGGPKYTGTWDCATKVLKEEGLFNGLYKGTQLTLLRDIPGSMAYYAAYDVILDNLRVPGESLSVGKTLFAGGMAGCANWIISVPPDVLKSRYQTSEPGRYPGGLSQILKELVAKEGIGALYKGLAPAMLRAFPANAACFLGMETSKKFMNMYF